MSKLPLAISSIALVIAVAAFFRQENTIRETTVQPKSSSTVGTSSPGVAERMITLQWLTNKLYFAGKARNKALSEFYFHEIHEKMADFSEADITDEGMQLSPLMAAHGLTAVDYATNKIKDNGFADFENIYSGLIEACNNCHLGAGHPYIRIAVPKTPVADNQSFE